MSNVSISEIQTTSNHLDVGDLLLVSKFNSETNSYNSVKMDAKNAIENIKYYYQNQISTPGKFTHWCEIIHPNKNYIEYHGLINGPFTVNSDTPLPVDPTRPAMIIKLPQDIVLTNPYTGKNSGGVFFTTFSSGSISPETAVYWNQTKNPRVIDSISVLSNSEAINMYIDIIAIYGDVLPLVNR